MSLGAGRRIGWACLCMRSKNPFHITAQPDWAYRLSVQCELLCSGGPKDRENPVPMDPELILHRRGRQESLVKRGDVLL